MKPTCGSCAFFVPNPGAKDGICRFFPPTPVMVGVGQTSPLNPTPKPMIIGVNPTLPVEHWCAQWNPQKGLN